MAAAFLGACASDPGPVTGESISIPYDPYDFDPDDLQAEADAHCEAYGLRAVYDGETVDTQSVRWRYRHFRCV
ncbi:hypothetical protein [Hyphococcus luteus]|uniref:Uncharacterized protein n=1 Tax=Hyphococcus luteus TaxID=2058213 RepID=A0A2S7K5N8_9PROT|nr:hypothetical protein [Marinicaulis flavus]PQA87791.1 hypothetical protein CW354_05380 [Marinicaulis flavus]